MSTAATGWGPVGGALAIPFGIACGIGLGLVNGVGVAYLRIPSMIVTLAVNAVAQGLMVVHTGGFSPQDSSSLAMRVLATGDLAFGLPNALIVWAVVGAGAIFLLNRTTFGRAVYGIGNRERAAYLSGIDTQRIVLTAFAIAGGLSAFGGVLLAGYASKAAQGMGDAYLLPAIRGLALDQRPEHRAAGYAEDIAGDARQLDVGGLQQLQEPVAFGRLALHQLAAVAQQLAQFPQRPGRHEALGDLSHQIGDPLGILHIGLAPRHVADVPGVADDQFEMPLQDGMTGRP